MEKKVYTVDARQLDMNQVIKCGRCSKQIAPRWADMLRDFGRISFRCYPCWTRRVR